jgi:hypothetical protein
MRQLNIAQRCVNAIAMVRNCAFVAVVKAAHLPRHLLAHTSGTSRKSPGYERPGRDSWVEGWVRSLFTSMRLQPVMQPISQSSRREVS